MRVTNVLLLLQLIIHSLLIHYVVRNPTLIPLSSSFASLNPSIAPLGDVSPSFRGFLVSNCSTSNFQACMELHLSTSSVLSSYIPSATHVSKSQHEDKVPTFEPQETIIIWLKSDLDYFMQKHSQILCWELGQVFARPNSQHKSQALPSQSVVI